MFTPTWENNPIFTIILEMGWLKPATRICWSSPLDLICVSAFYSLMVEQAAHELLETNTYDLQCREAKNIYSLQNIMPYMLIKKA